MRNRFFLLFFIFLIFPLKFAFSLQDSCAYSTECEDKVSTCWSECCVWEETEGTSVCSLWGKQCSCKNEWEEYRAEADRCGDVKILKRVCRGECVEGGIGACTCPCCKTTCEEPEVVAICNPWQKPTRKGCNGNVTKWGLEEVICQPIPKCFAPTLKVKDLLDGRGVIKDLSKVHLPVKFRSDNIETPGNTGWGLSCGPNAIGITIGNFQRKVNIYHHFSLWDEKNATSDKTLLENLWRLKESDWELEDLEKLANFLIRFTNDSSLKAKEGETIVKKNEIEKGDLKTMKLNLSEFRIKTYHSEYEKLREALKYYELRKQIEYFIFFTETIEISDYLKNNKHPTTNETIDHAYCGYYGGRNPEIEAPEVFKGVTITYSPSQDREVGPCLIPSGATREVKLSYCLKDVCGPDGPPLEFMTVDAPEPIGILAFSKEDITWIYTLENQEQKRFLFSAKVTRWIDTDWNGDLSPAILSGVDFVDFQFCGQNIEPLKPNFNFRALYRGKKIIFDSSSDCPKDPELEQRKESAPKMCVDINEECECEAKPQRCDKYCGRVGEITDLDICHPLQNPESLRIPKEAIKDANESIEKNRLDEEPLGCTPSYQFASSYGIFLGETEEIFIDWKDDPYYGVLNLPYPKDLWKWDLLVQYFPASPIQNIWQVQINGSRYWSQKWHFTLTTNVPLKERREPFGENLWKSIFVPMTKNDLEATVIFYPINVPTFIPAYSKEFSGYKVFNRLQELRFEPPPRALSFKIEVCIPGKRCLDLPTIFQQLRYRKISEVLTKEISNILEGSLKKFTFWEIWPCLKYPGATKGNVNDYRLNKPFDIYITPCKDEWGEECMNITALINAKSTGTPPKELSPSPPSPAVVPRKLRMASVPGAPSYIVELISESKKEYCAFDVTTPTKEFTECWIDIEEEKNYTWRVKSCADTCNEIENENFLHCGNFSNYNTFYGCPLLPSAEPSSPKIGESFLPGEVTLSWEKIPCDATTVFYQLIVTYQRLPEEKRKECTDLEKKGLINKTLSNNSFVLPSLNCFGTYYWRIRGCLSPDCSVEVGRWGRPWYFNIVPKLPPSGGGGEFEGIGTCKKIAPDCGPGECGIEDFPKLIFNILNCLLWTGTPILLIVGVISTGLTLVFFATNVELMERIRKMWKGIGIGILIMFFGWTILNIIFLILGWRKEVFGDWFNPF